MPALFTRTSMAGQANWTSCAAAATDRASARSATTTATCCRGNSPLSRSRAAASAPALTSTNTRSAPARPRPMALASPSPLAAPVTTAVCPDSRAGALYAFRAMDAGQGIGNDPFRFRIYPQTAGTRRHPFGLGVDCDIDRRSRKIPACGSLLHNRQRMETFQHPAPPGVACVPTVSSQSRGRAVADAKQEIRTQEARLTSVRIASQCPLRPVGASR